MKALTIRQKLMTYLADAEDSKVNAIYTLLEKEIHEDHEFMLSDEQVKILEREQQLHLSGQSRSYNREEAKQIIKSQRNY